MSRIQTSISVAENRVDFSYFADGRFDTIKRYAALTAGIPQLVATSSYSYDSAGHVTGLTHARGGNTVASYAWSYNADGTPATFSNGDPQYAGEDAAYAYDAAQQLTGVTYVNNSSSDAAFDYDANGNQRTARRRHRQRQPHRQRRQLPVPVRFRG